MTRWGEWRQLKIHWDFVSIFLSSGDHGPRRGIQHAGSKFHGMFHSRLWRLAMLHPLGCHLVRNSRARPGSIYSFYTFFISVLHRKSAFFYCMMITLTQYNLVTWKIKQKLAIYLGLNYSWKKRRKFLLSSKHDSVEGDAGDADAAGLPGGDQRRLRHLRRRWSESGQAGRLVRALQRPVQRVDVTGAPSHRRPWLRRRPSKPRKKDFACRFWQSNRWLYRNASFFL